MNIYLIISSALFFGVHSDLSQKLSLQQVQVMFRHGDRVPELFPDRFPNDPNMHQTFYPMGSGGLTSEGKLRMYRLGQILRSRYSEFLGDYYFSDDVITTCSPIPRARLSLQLVLAGLFPPKGHQIWNKALLWQPVLLNYVPFQKSFIFNGDKCKEFIEEYKSVSQYPDVKKILEGYAPLLEQWTRLTGKKTPLTLDDVFLLDNNLDTETRAGLQMEPWMQEIHSNGTLHELRTYYQGVLKTYNSKLKRLYVGPLAQQITDNFNKKINGTSKNGEKIILYSGHDNSVINGLKIANNYKLNNPEFSSAIIYELWKGPGEYYVNVSYYLGIPEDLEELVIPDCEQLCPMNKFMNLTEQFQPMAEDTCTITKNDYFDENN